MLFRVSDIEKCYSVHGTRSSVLTSVKLAPIIRFSMIWKSKYLKEGSLRFSPKMPTVNIFLVSGLKVKVVLEGSKRFSEVVDQVILVLLKVLMALPEKR